MIIYFYFMEYPLYSPKIDQVKLLVNIEQDIFQVLIRLLISLYDQSFPI